MGKVLGQVGFTDLHIILFLDSAKALPSRISDAQCAILSVLSALAEAA